MGTAGGDAQMRSSGRSLGVAFCSCIGRRGLLTVYRGKRRGKREEVGMDMDAKVSWCLGMVPEAHKGLRGATVELRPVLFTPILTFPHQGGRDLCRGSLGEFGPSCQRLLGRGYLF